MPHRALIAFSGGGAKGIVHVGALMALEEKGVNPVGLAGTSAGAIVAALAASGFRSDDIINVETGETILGRLSAIDPRLKRSVDLFGTAGWLRVLIFRFVLRHRPIWWLLAAVSIGLSIPWWTLLIASTRYGLFVGAGVWLLYVLAICYVGRSILGGLANLQRFRNAFSELLRRKLYPKEPDRTVRMGDFGRDGRPCLKIVSANVSKRTLHLFSPDRTPDVPVADAVAASICLPVIFEPWTLAAETYVDGGIVSNLPAWPFDEERELDPETMTIAVEINDDTPLRAINRYNWLPAAILTGMFGSQELNLRVAGPAEQLALTTEFGLLDFDKPIEDVTREVSAVAADAGLRLDKRLFRLPEIYRDACSVAQALALDALSIAPGGRGSAARIRVSLARLERGYTNSLRLSHSIGFESDADEGMLVPLEGSVAGRAWQESTSQLERYPLPDELNLPGEQNRMRRKTRWADLQWVMCIPIVDPDSGAPRLLVQLEGNFALTPPSKDTIPNDILTELEGVEEAVKSFFGVVLNELRELENDHGL